jgi:hypothetical protein
LKEVAVAVQRRAVAVEQRMRLVIALTEINSRHLSAEGKRAGAEIELLGALEEQASGGLSADLSARIDTLRERLAAADSELRGLEAERGRLDLALADFDQAGNEP